MSDLRDLISYLRIWHNWTGPDGLFQRVIEHLGYSGAALAIAVAIGLPLGVWLGHHKRGGAVAINATNVGRAVPTLAVLVLLFVILGDHRTRETVLALTLFALAPIVTNAYIGVRDVDAEVIEAARGMGLSGWQVLRRVELPLAVGLLMAGVRIAVVQVVATATIAAYIGAGGLGRPILDGLPQHDYGQVLAGAALVVVMALVFDVALGVLQRRLDPLRRTSGTAAADPLGASMVSTRTLG
ncbi:MAG: ABC transporter permease [Actinomycetes bacterium]